jgi:hypothetical protein
MPCFFHLYFFCYGGLGCSSSWLLLVLYDTACLRYPFSMLGFPFFSQKIRSFQRNRYGTRLLYRKKKTTMFRAIIIVVSGTRFIKFVSQKNFCGTIPSVHTVACGKGGYGTLNSSHVHLRDNFKYTSGE